MRGKRTTGDLTIDAKNYRDAMRVIALLLLAVSLIEARAASAARAPATHAPCGFPPTDSAWTATALDGWQRASSRALHAPSIRFPTLVLFDSLCSYTLLPATRPAGDVA